MSALVTDLKKGCTGPEAINIWLMDQQRRAQSCTVSFNSYISRAPITWYQNVDSKISIDCSGNLSTDIRFAHGPIVTCGLIKRVGMKFYYGHYYCIYINPVSKQLFILNPNGHSSRKHTQLRQLYYALSSWVKQHCGITLRHNYSTILNGPQRNYNHYDKGYCGPWACMVLYHIVKRSDPDNTFKAISKLDINELKRHINAVIKSIANSYSNYQRKVRIVLPPINGPKDEVQHTCRGIPVSLPPQSRFPQLASTRQRYRQRWL